MAEAVERAAGGRLTARLHGSTYVAMSAFQTKDNCLAVHLVNYAAPKAAGPLRLELGAAWNNRGSARLLTPEGGDHPLSVTTKGNVTMIDVPSLDVYGIVVVGRS